MNYGRINHSSALHLPTTPPPIPNPPRAQEAALREEQQFAKQQAKIEQSRAKGDELDLSNLGLTHILRNALSSESGKPKKGASPLRFTFTSLRLSDNQFTTFPPTGLDPLAFDKLTNLDLSYNQLRGPGLPQLILFAGTLRVLNLSHNCLFEVPPEILSLSHLEDLSLANNKIDSFPGGDRSPLRATLTSLNLSNNQFTAVPLRLLHHSLTHLNLSRNSITSIPAELAHCTQLIELSMGYNHIKEIPAALFTLSQLQKLLLHKNPISGHISPEISHLRSLARLILRSTLIQSLPPQIGQLSKLQELDILLCPRLLQLPCDIMYLPALEIIEYERHKAKGAESQPLETSNRQCRFILSLSLSLFSSLSLSLLSSSLRHNSLFSLLSSSLRHNSLVLLFSSSLRSHSLPPPHDTCFL